MKPNKKKRLPHYALTRLTKQAKVLKRNELRSVVLSAVKQVLPEILRESFDRSFTWEAIVRQEVVDYFRTSLEFDSLLKSIVERIASETKLKNRINELIDTTLAEDAADRSKPRKKRRVVI